MTSVPSTVGIVASGEDVLNDAVFWVDAGRSSILNGALSNLGTGGSALNAVFGNSTGVDSFDPALLTHTGTNYLYLPGLASNYASRPDDPVLDITGDIEIVMRVAPDSWSPTAEQYLVAKYFTTTSQRSFALSMTATGRLAFRNSVDGINAIYRESAISGFTAGTAYWIKVTLDVDTGSNTNLTTFSYAFDQTTEPSSWTTLSSTTTTSPVTTTTSIHSGSAALEVGSITSGVNSLAGKVYRAIVRNGIGGTTVFDADFTTGIASGAQTTFTESSANAATVTINRATSGRKSVAVTRPILLFGTDDYLEVADNNLLDFGASDSFTALVVVRQWNTPTSFGRYLDKKNGGGVGVGYSLSPNGALLQPGMFLGDGANQVGRVSPTPTVGSLNVVSGVVDRTAQTATVYTGITAGTSGSTSTLGSMSNAIALHIGVSNTLASAQDFELVAAAVWRRALNANEIATIVNRYT